MGIKGLEIECDNMICDIRGKKPRCYLVRGPGNYVFCDKYKYWRKFKERHDKISKDRNI